MESKSKFLVLNPSPEGLDKVLGKANLQQSKNGPFEAVFLLGDVLSESIEKLPTTKLSVQTYFSEGVNGRSNALEPFNGDSVLNDVDQNLTFLNSKVNIFKISSGFNIMVVSGKAEQDEEEEIMNIIRENKLPIDILLTNHWPLSIANQQKLHLVGNKIIDVIVKAVKPRYLFAVGHDKGKFFENKPFAWSSGEITRFISLGEEGSGERWFYAFSISNKITPEDIPLQENPFEVVETHLVTSKRPIEETDKVVEVKKPKIVSPDECFFCLSNPKTETHMIISIGTQTYLTTAKGPLTRPNRYLPFSGHIIIIPIEHIPTIRSKYPNVIESPIYQEVEQYYTTLVKTFSKQNDFYKLISFEVNRLANVHQGIQLIPVPGNLLEKFPRSLESRVTINNEKHEGRQPLEFKKFTDSKDPALVEIINTSDHIIFTLFISESEREIYICALSGGDKSVDFQFPRRVMAHLLNLPRRVYWDQCKQSKVEESKDCEEFKKYYHDYDFTL
ncbi:CwfJ C-terminus 1-domain-containing protein-like protein [Scheffersomyces coipomensis]|uniref:CwfJ C-terminus 1-domain-containing protein-like protein n=1 Tax=Scheffersomyces coipomensis TaxID=1788519 RepID=UPI00315C7BCD